MGRRAVAALAVAGVGFLAARPTVDFLATAFVAGAFFAPAPLVVPAGPGPATDLFLAGAFVAFAGTLAAARTEPGFVALAAVLLGALTDRRGVPTGVV